jgi:predicted transcriptional regulator
VDYAAEDIAKDLFEISSEQRLEILFRLEEKKSAVSVIAKQLDATVPEVFRNFERLVKAGLIEKEVSGDYHLTLYGTTILAQIPSLTFLSKNKNYFKNHSYGNIPAKFIQRIGALSSGKHIKGMVKVLELWKDIHKNAEKYIYNILTEIPYSPDIIETVAAKAKQDVNIRSVLSDQVIVPNARKEVYEKLQFKKFIDKGVIERRMQKDVQVVVLLNETEASILFPKNGEADMTEMLYSSDPVFHEWCFDYFQHCWASSTPFQERKLVSTE